MLCANTHLCYILEGSTIMLSIIENIILNIKNFAQRFHSTEKNSTNFQNIRYFELNQTKNAQYPHWNWLLCIIKIYIYYIEVFVLLMAVCLACCLRLKVPLKFDRWRGRFWVIVCCCRNELNQLRIIEKVSKIQAFRQFLANILCQSG